MRNHKNEPTVDKLTQGIFDGDTAALAQAITLVESANPTHFEKANHIIERCLKKKNKTVRIGITGVPGVGKSTFIETFGKLLTGMGQKVAILAVDPTSSLTKGSILGDKTRMNELSRDPNAFIRPSASGDSLGGVTRKTRESIVLCEAAGYEVILVETVGVGQSEIAVHSMVDFFLLLKLAGAGDELQGIKRGIMEMADAITINKADGDNIKKAQSARTEFARALHLYPPKKNGWLPKVMTCSAQENSGIEEIWKTIQSFVQQTTIEGHFQKNRHEQNKNWFFQSVETALKTNFYQNEGVKKEVAPLLKKIEDNTISPFVAANQLVSKYKPELK